VVLKDINAMVNNALLISRVTFELEKIGKKMRIKMTGNKKKKKMTS